LGIAPGRFTTNWSATIGSGPPTSAGLKPAGIDPVIRRTPPPTALLGTLVGDLRLSNFEVELLTGRLARSVGEDCRSAAVEQGWLPRGVYVERLLVEALAQPG